MFSPSHEALAEISVPNLQYYCNKHGYEMRLIEVENDKWEFKKHEAFKEWLYNRDADLIFYKDIDSLIMNMSIPITSFVGSRFYYLTKDFNELNNGVCLLKNKTEGRWVNDEILLGKNNFANEQNAINEYMKSPLINQIVKVLPHPSINSYDYSLYPECKEYVSREDLGDWQPGNFLIHFPGLGLEKRIEMLKEYSKKIIE